MDERPVHCPDEENVFNATSVTCVEHSKKCLIKRLSVARMLEINPAGELPERQPRKAFFEDFIEVRVIGNHRVRSLSSICM